MSEPLSATADASASDASHFTQLEKDFATAGLRQTNLWRLGEADDLRYTRWAGQSPDGRRWDANQPDGKPVLPYDGAPDTRIPLADELCNEEADLLVTAFWMADLKFSPVGGEDLPVAKQWRKYFEWLVYTRMVAELDREVELSAQYRGHYGWCLLHVDWLRRMGFRRQALSLEQLAGIDPTIATLVQDPASEDVAVDAVVGLYAAYAEQQAEGLDDVEIPTLKRPAARKAVRALRQGGKAAVALPYLCENRPVVRALKPWDDVVVAWGNGDLQSARAIFTCEWYTEADLTAAAAAEEWDDAWYQQALRSKGKRSIWRWNQLAAVAEYQVIEDPSLELIEIVRGYARVVDEEGVEVIRRTTFCPGVKGSYGAMETLEHLEGMYPFAEIRRERLGRSINQTRSIPQIAGPWQGEAKTHSDMLAAAAELTTVPPVTGPKLGFNYRFGPGGYVGDARAAQVKPLLLTQPGGSIGSIQMLQQIALRGDRYFGRPSAAVPPIVTSLRRQRIAGQFFSGWAEVFKTMLRLVQRCADPKEIERVTNLPAPMAESGHYDVVLHYDTRFLDPDFVKMVMEQVNQQILPTDSTGTTNRAKLTRWMWGAVDPALADQLTMAPEEAGAQLHESVGRDVAMMYLGNEAQYVAEDPAAGAKLQMLQQIVGANPNYQQGLQQNPRFQALMKNYVKNLAMSVEQQQNKMTGRTGVKPVDAQKQMPGAGLLMALGSGS